MTGVPVGRRRERAIAARLDWDHEPVAVGRLSIAFAPLNLVLLAFSWPPRWHVTGTTHGWLFVSVGLVP